MKYSDNLFFADLIRLYFLTATDLWIRDRSIGVGVDEPSSAILKDAADRSKTGSVGFRVVCLMRRERLKLVEWFST